MVRALKTLLPRNAAVTSDFQNPTAVGQLLQDNPGELVQRYAGTLLQPFARPEQAPVGTLDWSARERWIVRLRHRRELAERRTRPIPHQGANW